ncbi:hypothetical protein Cantr_01853 [Candida viswanathii]|uniref:Protein phosphatase type 2A regulatory subunit RTS3 n=1 Tax=Candida viswanathii TaxID=5486 RepID=A0A367YM68_9ASCO|nr:hypothetical protein Cantr_01853 [Candida viswanathii]
MSNPMVNTRNTSTSPTLKQQSQLSTPTTTPTSPRMSASASSNNTPHSHSQAPPPSIFTSISPRNSITSFSNGRPNLTNNSQRNYSISSSTSTTSSSTNNSPSVSAGSPKRYSFSEYSNEQIIDLMEREQDAIVLKLMKEIEMLKQENKMLKMNNTSSSTGNNGNSNGTSGIMSAPITPLVRRSSSLSSRSSSGNNSRSGSVTTLMTSAPVFNYSFREREACVHNNCANNSEIVKKHKGEFNPSTRKVSLKYDEIVDENRSLKRELKKLQGELELLKNKG